MSDFSKIYSTMIFPIVFSVNMFSMTIFMILLGIIGSYELAADVGIIQAACAMVFLGFSTNARNIILGNNKDIGPEQLFKFRVILVIPLSLISYFFCSSIVSIDLVITTALVLRKATEWIAEIQINHCEVKNNIKFAKLFLILQTITFFLLLILIDNNHEKIFYIVLYLWALSPVYLILPYLNSINILRLSEIKWKILSPHLGSTSVIGISNYVFRVFILLLTGKITAGILFSAFAIGGMLNSIYVYAVGPTLASQVDTGKYKTEKIILVLIFSCLVSIGSAICYIEYHNQVGNTSFIFAVGMSLIGCAFMLVAQRCRIYLIQKIHTDTFIPDVIINVLIISSIPFIYYSFGKFWLSSLVLSNSIITLIFYLSHMFSLKHVSNINYYPNTTISRGLLRRDLIQAFLLAPLFLPMFFMLDGGAIFNSMDMNYQSNGVLSKLPLPLSIFSCMLGIVLLSKLNKCKLSASYLFIFFITLVFSSFANLIGDTPGDLGRLVLLVQFCLPVFAFILGQSLENPDNFNFSYQSVGIFVLLFIVPFEVFATIFQSPYESNIGFLTPYLYLFSIYQHLQYVPVILVGLYCICVPALYENAFHRRLCMIVSGFIGVYVVWSNSRLALLLLLINIFYWLVLSLFLKKHYFKYLITIFILSCSLFIGFKSMQQDHIALKYPQKVVNIFHSVKNYNQYIDVELPKDNTIDTFGLGQERKSAVFLYWDKSTAEFNTFLFGNSKQIPKSDAISAFNYYLDLLYHFGFIALAPVIYLLFYTLYRLIVTILDNKMSVSLFSLSIVTLFFIFIDNSFKVSLRQPYPGIIQFFFLGVLLNHLKPSGNTKVEIIEKN